MCGTHVAQGVPLDAPLTNSDCEQTNTAMEEEYGYKGHRPLRNKDLGHIMRLSHQD